MGLGFSSPTLETTVQYCQQQKTIAVEQHPQDCNPGCTSESAGELQKMLIPGPIPDELNQNIWGWNKELVSFSSLGVSNKQLALPSDLQTTGRKRNAIYKSYVQPILCPANPMPIQSYFLFVCQGEGMIIFADICFQKIYHCLPNLRKREAIYPKSR